MTKIFCDHCGKQLLRGKDFFGVEPFAGKNEFLKLDLCDKCYNEMNEMLYRFVQEYLRNIHGGKND